jgi:tRNA(Ile2) C34 agmatinyltransferase TiaS
MAATLALPLDLAPAGREDVPTPRPEGVGRTLDDVLVSAWEELTGHASVACPVCRGTMEPRYGSESRPVGGRCRRCGSTLG